MADSPCFKPLLLSLLNTTVSTVPNTLFFVLYVFKQQQLFTILWVILSLGWCEPHARRLARMICGGVAFIETVTTNRSSGF